MSSLPLQDQWIERVLKFSVGTAALDTGAATIATLKPPDAPPSDARTRAMSAEASRLPTDDLALPEHIVGLAPRYFGAVLDEPLMSAKALQAGDAIPAQDQMLGISAQLDTLGGLVERWTAALDQAEKAKAALAPNGDVAASPNNDTAAAVETYEAHRSAGAALRLEVEATTAAIRAACKGLEATGGEAALT